MEQANSSINLHDLSEACPSAIFTAKRREVKIPSSPWNPHSHAFPALDPFVNLLYAKGFSRPMHNWEGNFAIKITAFKMLKCMKLELTSYKKFFPFHRNTGLLQRQKFLLQHWLLWILTNSIWKKFNESVLEIPAIIFCKNFLMVDTVWLLARDVQLL